jgi:3-oxoacyl-[acyl-carrier protein] reductase
MEKKTVLITGGSRGIGKAVSLEFARSGYFVLINFKSNTDEANKTLAEIEKENGSGELCQFDVSDSAQVKENIKKIAEKHDSIDVLVNNAGIVRNRLVSNLPEADWDDVIKTNLSAPFFLMRECSRIMMKQKSGSIINISSIIGLRGLEGCSNYSASKAGLVSLTKTAAKELGRFNVCVNAVVPGFHTTDMGSTARSDYIEMVRSESVLGTTTCLDELSKFIVFLSGLKTVSGQVFNIDSRII